MKRGWMVAFLGAWLLMGAACSQDEPVVGPPKPCPPAENPTPELALKDLDGQDYDIRLDQCDRPVLIAFGTTWCSWCSVGLPAVQEIHETYRASDLRVLAVYFERDLELLREYFAAKETTFPVLQDDHGYVSYFWDANAIPTYVLVSSEGEEVFRQLGYSDDLVEVLTEAVDTQLNR